MGGPETGSQGSTPLPRVTVDTVLSFIGSLEEGSFSPGLTHDFYEEQPELLMSVAEYVDEYCSTPGREALDTPEARELGGRIAMLVYFSVKRQIEAEDFKQQFQD